MDLEIREARQLRAKVYKEDGLKSSVTQGLKVSFNMKECPICTRIMVFKTTTAPSLDHIVSISNGGRHILSNFRVICLSCNASRGNNDTKYGN